MEYELELDKVIENIKKNNAKIVCIQLPDGMKRYAEEIQKKIEEKSESKIVIWMGSCYGACDVPEHIEKLGIDMLIQWGHSEWEY